MSRPLLALDVRQATGPQARDTIRIDFHFSPRTLRRPPEALLLEDTPRTVRGFFGPTVFMAVIGYEKLSLALKVVARQLASWLVTQVNVACGVLGNDVRGSVVNQEWSMTWETFGLAMARYAPLEVDSEGTVVLGSRRVEYAVQCGYDGRVVSVEFAL